ncbi:hypothetical protein HanRHA438_Chr08g0327481 [Helianthus annuus]|nr:hypothetical protein HanRHA438_Chr08g0327481 [Helianthus annuus]
MTDGLTTCCTFAGVSGLSVVDVTPRQSVAYVALTGDCHWCHLHCGVSPTCWAYRMRCEPLPAVTSDVIASLACDQEIREMRCWPHRRLW